ncbi:MAG TPA: metalloregulator ArsR/SmtB family transcription factor [Longimicrobiales bacterium]|nr:metalloregulator ArsR/SmtB family transcription factor [Longimicrobiales bacterium]
MNAVPAVPATTDDIHGRLGSLADSTRTRLLLLLARHELSVGELCGAVQLPQSTVSRHLKVLGDEGWLATRAEGPSRFYRLSPRLDEAARRLWQVVRQELAGRPESAQDEARAQQVLQQRRTRSREFFSTAAGQWDAVRAELFGARGGLAGLLALLGDDLVIGDLGCGTGAVSSELAPFAGRVIAVDESKAMLSAARRRLQPFANVELRTGSLESLPVEPGELDAALISLVLHYVPEPARALAEAHRALRPGGRLVVVDMQEHGRAEYREQYGHVWQGFGEAQVRGWLEEAGFTGVRWHGLAPDPSAKGPVLFAASAARP